MFLLWRAGTSSEAPYLVLGFSNAVQLIVVIFKLMAIILLLLPSFTVCSQRLCTLLDLLKIF